MTIIDIFDKRVTMNDRINKTSICSIVFLDIIDYTKTPVSEQIEVKNQFNEFINIALKDVAQNDRIIIDTGDGAAIAYMGSPEDALFMAMSIRDGILKNNATNLKSMLVRMGINLGPVRVVKDINGHPNIIGDGINVAQRIMNFAKPNQILVSRSYYEVTSRLTQEMSKMFDYSGMKQDKHVREHEVYSVRIDADQMPAGTHEEMPEGSVSAATTQASASKINWKYVASGLVLVAALFALIKALSVPTQPEISITLPPAAATPAALTPSLKLENKPAIEAVKETKTSEAKAAETSKDKPATQALSAKAQKEKAAKDKLAQDQMAKTTLAKARLAKKNVKQKSKPVVTEDSKTESPAAPAHTEITQNQTTTTHTSKPATEKVIHKAEEKSARPVLEHVCSQAEIAMNTCH
jgi:class 3 adenylate cyclase